jgi:hypothetical protein
MKRPEELPPPVIAPISPPLPSPLPPPMIPAKSEMNELRSASTGETPEPVELPPYLVSQSLTLTTDVSGRRPEEETTVALDFSVDVGVTIQGACSAIRGE